MCYSLARERGRPKSLKETSHSLNANRRGPGWAGNKASGGYRPTMEGSVGLVSQAGGEK